MPHLLVRMTVEQMEAAIAADTGYCLWCSQLSEGIDQSKYPGHQKCPHCKKRKSVLPVQHCTCVVVVHDRFSLQGTKTL